VTEEPKSGADSSGVLRPSIFTTLGLNAGSWPLSWHLVALTIAAFAPAVALCVWLLARHIADAQQHIERDSIAQAEMWASSANQALSGAIGTMRALAASAALKNRDFKSFSEQATASFAGAGVTVRVRNRQLALLGDDPAEPANSETPLSKEEVRATLASPAPIVTGFRDSSGSIPAGVDIWIRAGPSRGEPLLLQARVPSEYFSRSLAPANIETPWSVALIDPAGRLVARSRSFKAELGATLSSDDASAAQVGSAAAPVTRGVDESGAQVIRVAAQAGIPGWRITAIAPRREVEARLDQYWKGFLAVAAVLALVMALAAGYVASAIARSVSTVSANARALTSGAEFSPVSTTIREVKDLMDTISATRQELIRRKDALRDSDHRLRMALDAGGMGVWEWDRQTDELTWDPVEFDLAGVPRGERPPTGAEFLARIVDEDRPGVLAALEKLSPDAPALAVDFRFKRYDGEVRWLSGRGLLLADAAGVKRGLIGVNYDTTDQRLNSERMAALLREVSHRSKNMLALILAMARLTARDATDVNAHVKEFSARVAGLAASQDLIVASDWQGVDVAALAAAEARAIAHDSAPRVVIAGPPLTVSPEAAQTLGMVFTELMLNAIQHGALSTARGQVHLNWDLADGALQMSWREIGGPEVSANCGRGYGMSVVERFAEQGLKATAKVDPRPDGLVWTLSAPLKHLGAKSA
jgi:two-component sensor histidine kinase